MGLTPSARSDPDRQIAALAARQHGPVARRQLESLGLSRQQIGHRVKAGRLIGLYPAVYAVGHPILTREGRWMAAVLACSPRAVLSHDDAAAHWAVLPAHGARIDVSTDARSGRVPDRRRIRLHRTGTLAENEGAVQRRETARRLSALLAVSGSPSAQ
jgi:hypothetical protein